MKIFHREVNQLAAQQLIAAGISPLMANLYAARGVENATQLEASLSGLIPPNKLTNNLQMAKLLADAIAANKKLLVIGDYDADGATATAVAVRGLRSMGANVDFLVPNRFEYGYGLTPEIVKLAVDQSPNNRPDILITVDNGIASVDGVAAANALGLQVLITDHHLPGDTPPKAACMINPNQHGCDFPSKNLAGVGVIFYCLLALRAEQRARGLYVNKIEPNLSELLDLVALGTVADLVKLDDNNRILVEQGLRRIRAGKACFGIIALLKLAGRDDQKATAQDLGFYVGPRLNAAGRLDDMSLGIACLLADTEEIAQKLAQQLHELNHARRDIEADMTDTAQLVLDDLQVDAQYSISLFQPEWHQGVIGILASRIKERYHRPVIAFANATDGAILKGSGRSIASLHLRDALDLLSKQMPDLIIKFGGHAMAAGLTIKADDFLRFKQGFEAVCQFLLSPADLQAVMLVDVALAANDMTLQTAIALDDQVWGQGFASPTFCDEFAVVNQRVVGEKHLKLRLKKGDTLIDAIYFGQVEFLPDVVQIVYELKINQYNNVQSVQLLVRYVV